MCDFAKGKIKGVTALADFRLSAQIIKRSSGRSATASAAYRASERVLDERTGLTHDYSRKGGTLHAEIMTPDNTPEWMRDRAQLWNAVEKVERRKDAQLAREVQLSLPHELNPEQRLELVRGFVVDQFVSQGMIADVAIHAPNERGDERNHHAHIMLTMREVTAEGFGNKNRDWNNSKHLENWREQWAHHQNRELERYGHAERVDHRSYADRGIEKAPQQHMGQTATDMERRGKPTRIGEQNRATQLDNAKLAKSRAYAAVLSAQVSMQKRALNTWANEKRHTLKDRLRDNEIDIRIKHRTEREQLKTTLKNKNQAIRTNISSQIKTVENRITTATGARKIIRALLGQNKADKRTLHELQKALQGVRVSEQIQRVELQRRQQREFEQFRDREREEKQKLERTIEGKQEHEVNLKDRLRAEYQRTRKASNENKKERKVSRQNENIELKPY